LLPKPQNPLRLILLICRQAKLKLISSRVLKGKRETFDLI